MLSAYRLARASMRLKTGLRGFAVAKPIPDTESAREVAALVERSRAALAEIEHYTQEQVDDLITAMVYSVAKEDTAKMIAQHTIDETKLGNYDGKFLKIFRKTRATLLDIIDDKSVGVIEEDKDREIVKVRGVVPGLARCSLQWWAWWWRCCEAIGWLHAPRDSATAYCATAVSLPPS